MNHDEKDLVLGLYYDIKNYLIDSNQQSDDEISSMINFQINKLLFFNQMFVTNNQKREEGGIAFMSHNQILIYSDKINFQSDRVLDEISDTIIHELTHILLYFFPMFDEKEPITKHTLEFAIMCYVLYYNYTKSPLLFRLYDFHEDKKFKKMRIDEDNLNRFISTIKFKNLHDLYEKSVKFSEQIRNKF